MRPKCLFRVAALKFDVHAIRTSAANREASRCLLGSVKSSFRSTGAAWAIRGSRRASGGCDTFNKVRQNAYIPARNLCVFWYRFPATARTMRNILTSRTLLFIMIALLMFFCIALVWRFAAHSGAY